MLVWWLARRRHLTLQLEICPFGTFFLKVLYKGSVSLWHLHGPMKFSDHTHLCHSFSSFFASASFSSLSLCPRFHRGQKTCRVCLCEPGLFHVSQPSSFFFSFSFSCRHYHFILHGWVKLHLNFSLSCWWIPRWVLYVGCCDCGNTINIDVQVSLLCDEFYFFGCTIYLSHIARLHGGSIFNFCGSSIMISILVTLTLPSGVEKNFPSAFLPIFNLLFVDSHSDLGAMECQHG